MAFKSVVESGDHKLWYFTLNAISVGKNGNNTRRSDVQLVQFFLKKFYEQQPYLRQVSGLSGIKIDGIAGEKTAKGIWWFQHANSGIGNSIKVDGLVSVMLGNGISSISSTVYTILHLNRYFQMQGDGKEHHRNLEKHPDIIENAPELVAELSKQTFDADRRV